LSSASFETLVDDRLVRVPLTFRHLDASLKIGLVVSMGSNYQVGVDSVKAKSQGAPGSASVQLYHSISNSIPGGSG
jgi:hypothetical protein